MQRGAANKQVHDTTKISLAEAKIAVHPDFACILGNVICSHLSAPLHCFSNRCGSVKCDHVDACGRSFLICVVLCDSLHAILSKTSCQATKSPRSSCSDVSRHPTIHPSSRSSRRKEKLGYGERRNSGNGVAKKEIYICGWVCTLQAQDFDRNEGLGWEGREDQAPCASSCSFPFSSSLNAS